MQTLLKDVEQCPHVSDTKDDLGIHSHLLDRCFDDQSPVYVIVLFQLKKVIPLIFKIFRFEVALEKILILKAHQ